MTRVLLSSLAAPLANFDHQLATLTCHLLTCTLPPSRHYDSLTPTFHHTTLHHCHILSLPDWPLDVHCRLNRSTVDRLIGHSTDRLIGWITNWQCCLHTHTHTLSGYICFSCAVTDSFALSFTNIWHLPGRLWLRHFSATPHLSPSLFARHRIHLDTLFLCRHLSSPHHFVVICVLCAVCCAFVCKHVVPSKMSKGKLDFGKAVNWFTITHSHRNCSHH